MNLAVLHREKMIQPHHWEAANWLRHECEAYSCRSPILIDIAERCRILEAQQVGPQVEPFSLLLKACVKLEPFTANESVVGVLREGLNIVHRVMEKQRASI